MEPAPGAPPSGVSVLFVTTVTNTLRFFLAPYAAHLRALGWRVDAAANGAAGDPALRDAFDHAYDLPLTRSPFNVPRLVRSERAIREVLEISRPDIVHVHSPIAAFVSRLAVRRLPADRRPAVAYTAHGFHFHGGGNPVTNAFFLGAEKMAGRWTDRLIVINAEDHVAALRHRIVRPSRLVRMPGIGVDTDVFSPTGVADADVGRARAALGAAPGDPLFVVIAEYNRNKRPGDAIRALARMRHTEARLALAGGGPLQARLEELATRCGVADRVRVVGFVDDIRPMVAGATALVLTSRREGLARSIMEALALEVPVIASTARGNRELVSPDSGRLVRTGDVGGYAAAMDWMIDHPRERDAMGLRGRVRMVEQYDVRTLILRHEDLYRQMLAGRG